MKTKGMIDKNIVKHFLKPIEPETDDVIATVGNTIGFLLERKDIVESSNKYGFSVGLVPEATLTPLTKRIRWLLDNVALLVEFSLDNKKDEETDLYKTQYAKVKKMCISWDYETAIEPMLDETHECIRMIHIYSKQYEDDLFNSFRLEKERELYPYGTGLCN